ncbi:unnamed protein product [Mytilus coruscus]|uniref:Uncharacterized protein n=1 Tax=Mytilus coruscus TaxID=42192 RepID=A0A6J8B3W7_MYTCO|nr:unnamed protein product [Mytilus coruscus]
MKDLCYAVLIVIITITQYYMSVRKIIKERKKIYQRVRGAKLSKDTILFTDSKGVSLQDFVPDSISDKFKLLPKTGVTVDSESHIKSLLDKIKDLDQPIILIWLGTCKITNTSNKIIKFRDCPYQNIEHRSPLFGGSRDTNLINGEKRAQVPPRTGGDENETVTDVLESETEFNLPDDTEPETDEGGNTRYDQSSCFSYQAAFRENFFYSPPDPHRLSETRAIHARSSNDKGSVRSARSRSKSYIQTDNTSSSEDSCPDSSDDESLVTSLLNRSKSKSKSDFPHNVKLPAYTEKEKWEVWYNQFEAVARLGKWDDRSKLRELLPHLQGAAGDFVFHQLPQVMNPFDQQFELHQDTVLGEAEQLTTETKEWVECEDMEEITNYSSVRRIKLTEAQPVQWETNTENECADIVKFLNQFSNTFSKNETDLGLTQLTEHSIDIGDAKPVRQPPRSVPMAYANDEKKLIDQMLDQGIIQRSYSPLASPLVLVVKKADYRPGPKHGNADAMSRCSNPRDCDCPETYNMEYLKCGSCAKCTQTALDMASSMKNLQSLNSVKTRNQTDQEKT